MNIIQLENINYARSYMEHPLENIQLTIKPGELIHLKGEIGVSKSTLIDIILGIKQPDSGTVKIFGDSPRELKSKLLTGVAPQKIGTPIENAQLLRLIDLIESHYPRASGKINSILEDFGLNFSPDKQKLSGGQERILFFAIAQAGSPHLLILDEPTTFLDTEDTEDKLSKLTKFWQNLQKLHDDGHTILLISHDREIGVQPTRTILLKDGKLNSTSNTANFEESFPVIDVNPELNIQHWISLLIKHVKFNIEQTFRSDQKYIRLQLLASLLWGLLICVSAKISTEDSSSLSIIANAYSFYLAMSAAISTGNIIAEERQNEIFKKLLQVLPLPPIIYLLAKVITSWLITNLFILIMVLPTLYVISPSVLIPLFASLTIGVIPYLFLGIALGYLFEKPKTIQIVALMLAMVLTIPVFARQIFNVTETILAIPGKLNLLSLIGDNIAAHSPIYHYMQIILFSGQAPEYDQYLWLHIFWLIWFTFISLFIALWAYGFICKKEAQA